MSEEILFVDLESQRKQLIGIDKAIQKVLMHGTYIMGPEVYELESQLSSLTNSKHVISCSSGTDALVLILMSLGIQKGDAVIVPSFTFAATAEVVAWLGATPIFVDVLPDTYNIDPSSIEEGIYVAKENNLKLKGIISVDLFGQPADYNALEDICEKNSLWLLPDGAQSYGASFKGKPVGSIGLATSTSFFPAKPLGCYGDGGAIFTNDTSLAEVIKSLRVHGQGSNKYDNVRIGINGRLDTIQAAILLEKLKIFQDELEARQKIANVYNSNLQDLVQTPKVLENVSSSWAQYTIVLNKQNREQIIEKLKSNGIPSVVYYPKPLHQQSAYKNYPRVMKLNVSEHLSENVLSLPIHPYLSNSSQHKIINTFSKILQEAKEREEII